MTKSLLSKLINNEGDISITMSVLVVILMFVTLNLRPAILGQYFGAFYSFFLISLTIFIIGWKTKIQFDAVKLKYISTCLLIASYVVLQIVIVGHSSIVGTIATLLYIFIGFLSILIINNETVTKFSKFLIGMCVLLGISYLITYVIFLLTGNLYSEYLINLPTQTDYVNKLEVLFPFSPVYDGTAELAGLKMPRAIGMMREPGLYQMILIIAYWLQDYYKFRYNYFIKFILVFSLFVTFSTAGYVLFLGTFMWNMFKNIEHNRIYYLLVGIPILSSLFYLLIFSESQFGLLEKFESNSGASRIGATLTSLELISKNPLFGIGFHIEPSKINIGINFLGTIAQLGLLGSIIFLLPIVYTWKKIKDGPIQVVNIFIVVVLTLLFAQPIYDKPLTFFLLSIMLVIGAKNIGSYTDYKYVLKSTYAA